MTYFVDFVYWNYPDIVRLRKRKKERKKPGLRVTHTSRSREKKRAKRAQSYWQQTQRGRSSAPF
jgi:hypothetical protein